MHRLRTLAGAKEWSLESNRVETRCESSSGRQGEDNGERNDGNAREGDESRDATRLREDLELCCRWLLDQGKALMSEIQELEAEAITRQLE